MEQATYPVQFSVDYPDRPLNRLTTCFRVFMVILVHDLKVRRDDHQPGILVRTFRSCTM
jgi:hypothetical protein